MNTVRFEPLRRNIERKIALTDEEWRIIAAKAEYITVKRNEYLQRQYAQNTYECFILKGAFKIFIVNEDGSESVIFFSFSKEWMCDIEAFYHKKPARYNIKAIQDSEVLVINKVNKMQLFKQLPKLVQFHIVMVERANIFMQQRLLDILNKTFKQRYAEFVKRYPQKALTINNKDLSSYLGVSQEFLSKVKKLNAKRA
ncbi:Crp/Fnr family transcriptional regulator [Flavobacterium zepuense]|uniref:Crp/Fnr family transcriptional regulator n=1 Tax=Flavobacterium zepuense TaxID=2593302 RepID=A0A552UZH8_9FLAO|nr:Crp/Fnr family transcriptional regulator [Flavobacterium zepuense]TRW23592.1 Crp/Fnr family transcriptional regulator [Flavobacterium zepuense]